MTSKKVLKHKTFIIVGIIMILTVLSKLIFNFDIDSDWFWLMAALAITIEGLINLKRQNQFENKYKIVSKKEFLKFNKFKKERKSNLKL